MNKIYFFLTIFFFLKVSYGQNTIPNTTIEMTYRQINDSLRKVILSSPAHHHLLDVYLCKAKAENNYKEQFKVYTKIMVAQNHGSLTHQYADSLFLLTEKLPESYYVDALQSKAFCYYVEKDYQNSLEFELKALQLINPQQKPYIYHSGMYNIGQVYFYLHDFEKAHFYYKQAREYFERSQKYNHIQGYFNALYREAFSLYYLEKYTESKELLLTGQNKMYLLREKDVRLKSAYFSYVTALNKYQKKQYAESIELLNNALPYIFENDDFANKAIIYYYLGMNYWQQNNKQTAVTFFKKTDDAFMKHQYSNPEIADAYSKLISFYKEQKLPEEELLYINKLLNVSQHLQNEYRFLKEALHVNMEIGQLKTEKAHLENQINFHKKTLIIVVILSITFAGIFLIFLATQIYLKKRYRRKNLFLNEQHRKEKVLEYHYASELTQTPPIINYTYLPQYSDTSGKKKKIISKTNNTVTTMLLEHLEVFEKEQLFLEKNISLDFLAKKWKTNRNYLSNCINTYKEKRFNDYINTLRINFLLKNLEHNPKWRCLKTDVVADMLGFTNVRSFSDAFTKVTGRTLSCYLQEMKVMADAQSFY